jgi:hypothetical protein
LAQLQAAYKKLDDLQRLETQKEAEFKAARDNAVAQEHAFHDLMLAVHDQIRAQFGADSNEYQSLGMVKKSEYKKRTPAKS